MNKTYNINLAGQIFHINEDAFDMLSDYLKSLKKIYQNEEGGDEIITDIESRIAEIFLLENKNNRLTIINIENVENVISTLGKPEQHIDGDEESESTYSNKSSSNKKLFRDSDSQIIAGVCSGLSHYFGINDPLWIRLIFLIFFFGGIGSSLMIYIVLWILLPKATTASEKLQMKGQPINVGNIEKTVRDGIQNIGDSFQNMSKKNSIQNAAKKSASIVQSILLFIFQITKAFLLFIFIIIFGILVFVSFFLGIAIIAGTPTLSNVIFENSVMAYITSIAAILLLVLTSLFFILFPIHLFSKDKKPLKNPVGISIAVIWAAAFIILLIGATDTVRHFSSKKSIQKEEVISHATLNDTIIISGRSNPNTAPELVNLNVLGGQFEIINGHINSNFVKLNLAQSPDQDIHIFEQLSARGNSSQTALNNVKNIDYQYRRSGDSLIFNDYVNLERKNSKYRKQEVEITLYIPEGKTIIFDNTQNLIHKKPRIKNFDNDEYFDLGSTPWKLEAGYLVPLNSPITSLNTSSWTDMTPLESFSKIELDGMLDAEIIYSTHNKIESNQPNNISISTNNNKISISRLGRIANQNYTKIKIYTTQLSDIEIDGMSTAIISNFNTNNMKIEVAGNSTLSLNNCNLQQLTAEIEGLSTFQGFSNIENAIIKMDGMSQLNGKNLIIKNLKADLNGASKASVFVSHKLKGESNGMSKLEYAGNPIIEINSKGNSTIQAIQ
ncbi:MAG: DUF2807 domain-containing protein [Chitinophagales bacterium]|nr:DUF2807 domain-containing protein [Chitinophagales bacterium]MCZ2394058.1 DUF2807 domain-containing protein [Chitinophagales bacterium]